jgi:Fur family ferric uptake transcriptional regulator
MKSARNTTAKTEIQELIVMSNVALSHAEIQKSLDGLCDRVTIYRVLERLLEEGVIHKIVSADGVVKHTRY